MKSSVLARSAIGVAAVLFTGSAAGCNAQDPSAPIVAVGEPAASQVSSSPGPPAAKGKEVAAVATARAWVSAYNDALRTGDRAAVDALTGEGCLSCNALIRSIDQVHRRGGYFRGGRWTITSARVTRQASQSATVRARVTVAARTTKASGVTEPESHPQDRFALQLSVRRVGDTSLVTRVSFLS